MIVYERVASSLYSKRMLDSFGLEGAIRVSPLHCNFVADIDRFLQITRQINAAFTTAASGTATRSNAMRMPILVADAAGVTTAYYLARESFEVTMAERQPGAALATSLVGAGQVSPSYWAPWAPPVPDVASGLIRPHARPKYRRPRIPS